MFLSFIDDYFTLCAFIISIMNFRHLKKSCMSLFPFFLLFILLMDSIELILPNDALLLYNISTAAAFVFYAYTLSLILREAAFKTMTFRFILVYPVLFLFNLFFIQGIARPQSYTMILGSVFMIIFCGLYFYEQLLDPREDHLLKSPGFWISTGILFYYLGTLSYDILFNILQKYTVNTGWKLFINIDNNLTLILYSCFIIAFLCKRNPRRSLSR